MNLARAAVGLLLLAGCRRDPIASCDDDLSGVYAGAEGTWMILDSGETLEAYPLFPDGRGAAAAPRYLGLAREGGKLAGAMRRRYTSGATACEATEPARVTSCAGDEVQLVVADPAAPLGFSPCAWGRGPGSRVERWQRQ